MTSITLSRWIPAAAALAFVAWAVTIWWMIATLPASGSESAPVEVAALVAEIDRLNEEVATLAHHIADLETARDSFNVAAPETAPLAAQAQHGDGVETEADAAGEVSEFFTDGADRYNCRNFSSYADAQEALLVNRLGDPNRIDMNNNNLACEDFAYPDRPGGSAPGAPKPSATPRP